MLDARIGRTKMAKKADKCKKCKHRVVLASLITTYGELEAIPDQEPYVSGTIEPIMVDGQEQKTLGIGSGIGLYVCPNCGTVDSVWVEEA